MSVSLLVVFLPCHLVAGALTFPIGCKTVMIAPLEEVTFKWKYYPGDKRPQAKGHRADQQGAHSHSALAFLPGASSLTDGCEVVCDIHIQKSGAPPLALALT